LDICVGFKFRRLDDGKPKYGSPVGQKTHLFNVTATMSPTKSIVVCEGEFDAIIMDAVVGVPAVGVPGVAAWKPFYPKLFNGFDVVYIVGDNDVKEDGTNPGAEFSRRVAGEVANSQIIQLPPGMDITDYYLAHGKESTANLVGGVQ
jgi:DNA primase